MHCLHIHIFIVRQKIWHVKVKSPEDLPVKIREKFIWHRSVTFSGLVSGHRGLFQRESERSVGHVVFVRTILGGWWVYVGTLLDNG
jgi:hypothetical protein